MKLLRKTLPFLFLALCMWENIFLIEAKNEPAKDIVLATQEVEDYGKIFLASNVSPKGVSVYYNTAKGWYFNDIVYVDSCLKYDNAYGGPSTGTLPSGYYRFVKTNGSYVALCEVNLVADTVARNSYLELWNKYGGMWSWEQAFYNQLDGTAELSNPSMIKTVTLENGKTVIDETQNYRFIKCWIKFEDLSPNPETVTTKYTQSVKYYVCNERTGSSIEKLELATEVLVEQNKEFTPEIKQIDGYQVKYITINGEKTEAGSVSYTVSENTEVCIYYRPNILTVKYYANGGYGTMNPQKIYYGETQKLLANKFGKKSAVFLGWGLNAEQGYIDYKDLETIAYDLTYADGMLEMYAVWDEAPHVVLQDLYFTKGQLYSMADPQAYILSFAKVLDKEDGEIVSQGGENFTFVTNLYEELDKISEGWLSYKVLIKDSAGNQLHKWGRLYIVDTSPVKNYIQLDKMRFINEEYMDTLDATSIWTSKLQFYLELKSCLKKTRGLIWKKTEFGWKKVG